MHYNRAAIAFLSCLSLMRGQQQPPAAVPAGGVPKFTSSTQLVVEIVSVRDKDGKPIEGLTAKDFTITENNVPQTISFCEYQKLDETVAPAAVAPPEPKPATVVEKPKADPTAAPAVAGAAPGEIKYR